MSIPKAITNAAGLIGEVCRTCKLERDRQRRARARLERGAA